MSCYKCGTSKPERLSRMWFIDHRSLPTPADLWVCKNQFKCRGRQMKDRPASMSTVKRPKPTPTPSRGRL